VAVEETAFARGLEGLPEKEVRSRLVRIERTLAGWSKAGKFYGHMFDDVLKMKYFHQRYTNYLKWLTFRGSEGVVVLVVSR